MKKINYTIAFIAMLFNYTYSQQNLVPNPSFESYTSCPTNIGEIPSNWSSYGGSPDYYNSCSTNNISSSPGNVAGYQFPYEGNAYIGMILFVTNSTPSREYLGAQLTQTLSIGTKYYVSAYISRADSSNSSTGNICACNNFGFRFSTNPYSYSMPVATDNFSHIHSSQIVNDSINWTKISGSFIADSNYKFIALGNFYDNSNTTTLNCSSSFADGYYYIDQICLSTDSNLCNIVSGIKKISNKESFSIYPNPSQNFININFPTYTKPYEIVIYNSFGQEVTKKIIYNSFEHIDILHLNNGVFYIKILNDNQVLNYKLLKQKE